MFPKQNVIKLLEMLLGVTAVCAHPEETLFIPSHFIKRVHHVMPRQFSREAAERRECALLVDVFAQYGAGQGVVSLRSHAERAQL